MTAITATATGGNWTSGATWVGGVAPTAADDAYLDATSGPVTINTGAVARSLDCTGYTGTLTHTAGVSLGLGDATAGAGNVALKLVAGMTYTLGSASTSGFSFVSTSATQQTITTAGKSLGNLYFFFAASYVLADANTVGPTATVNLLGGTLNTGNFACSWGLVVISGASAKTLTLGTSAITITGNLFNSVNVSGTGITITANTAIMTFTGAQGGIASTALNWSGLSLVFNTTNANLTNGPTGLMNVTVNGPASKTGLFSAIGTGFTITGTLTVIGNSIVNRVLMQSEIIGVARTVSAAVISLTNVDFIDITAAGAAIPWTGTSLGNALGNSNITFDTSATQTRLTTVGGNWSDAVSWTSRVPLPQDNVVVGTAQSGTMTVDMPRLGANIQFTAGFGGALNSTVAHTVYGSVALGANSTAWTGAFDVTFAARSAKTITSSGKYFPANIVIDAPGGSYTLQDDLTCASGGSSYITFTRGLLDTNAKNVNANWTINATAADTVTVTNSTLTCKATSGSPWNFQTPVTTLNAAGSTIVWTAVASAVRTFVGGGKTYGTFTVTTAGATGQVIITGANTFATINFSDASNARTLTLPSGLTTTINTVGFSFNVAGTAGKLMTINSSTPGVTATLANAGTNVVTCDYLSLQDITATASAGFPWYAGAHSSIVSNVSGWTFQKLAAPGGGAWTAGATWVGGVAPTASDAVCLDGATGPITIDAGAVARAVDCTAYVGTLTHTAGATLTLGDAIAPPQTSGVGRTALKLVSGMTYTLGDPATSAINFISTHAQGQIILTGGKTLGNWTINGAGSFYQLGDNNVVGTTATMTLSAGTFNTGNFACSWGLFVISGAGAKTLTLGSSAIAITGNSAASVNYSGSNLTITANTAVMTLSGSSAGITGGAWNGTSVVATSAVVDFRLLGTLSGLSNVTYNGGAIKASFIRWGQAFTITGTLTVNGQSAVNRILVFSDVTGTTRTITAAAVSLSNVDFSDITAAGAAGTWTGTSMGNALGNSNITFDAPTTQTAITGAAGNWSDVTKWTSRVPLPQDNVVVGSGTTGLITMDMPRLGADVSFAGFTGTASFASVANTLYGSLTLGSGMTVSGTQALTLAGRSAKTITSNTKAFSQIVNITAPGGTYTLVDAFVTASNFNVTDGTFSTGNFPLQAVLLGASGSGSRTISTGSSTITLTGTSGQLVDLLITGTTYNTSATAFVIATASASARSFATRGATFGTLTYTVAGSTGSLTFNGNNGANGGTFGTINFSDASNARSLLFNAGTTTTVTNWNVFGTAGKLMTVDSVTAATHTLSKPSANVTAADYLSIAHSIATGGAGWFAGVNSVDAGSNTGWQFADSPKTNFLEMF